MLLVAVDRVTVIIHTVTCNVKNSSTAAVLEWVSEEMWNPPYSHDLAPSDYHLFPNLKKHFHRQRFSTDDELKYATEE